jgi:hypothetical protein
VVVACAAALSAAAHHTPVTVTLASRPSAIPARTPWRLMLVVRQDGKPISRRPRLEATLGPMKRSFAAQATARRGFYRVRVVFPRAGRWTLAARLGRRSDALGRVTVRAAARG